MHNMHTKPGYFEQDGVKYHWKTSPDGYRLLHTCHNSTMRWPCIVPAGAATKAAEALLDLIKHDEDWIMLHYYSEDSFVEVRRDGSEARQWKGRERGFVKLTELEPFYRCYLLGLREGQAEHPRITIHNES